MTIEEEQASEIDRLEAEITRLREENSRLAALSAKTSLEASQLREALNGWQKWWELPWEGKRPDFAELVYRRAAAIAKASAVNPRDEGAPTI